MMIKRGSCCLTIEEHFIHICSKFLIISFELIMLYNSLYSRLCLLDHKMYLLS